MVLVPLRAKPGQESLWLAEWGSYAPKAESVSLQARSQRLQDPAHTRQCSMFISLAWYSHSSAHNRHASMQACRAALATAGSNSVCLERILPVVAHTSEQLRHMVMQRLICEIISSPRPVGASRSPRGASPSRRARAEESRTQ